MLSCGLATCMRLLHPIISCAHRVQQQNCSAHMVHEAEWQCASDAMHSRTAICTDCVKQQGCSAHTPSRSPSRSPFSHYHSYKCTFAGCTSTIISAGAAPTPANSITPPQSAKPSSLRTPTCASRQTRPAFPTDIFLASAQVSADVKTAATAASVDTDRADRYHCSSGTASVRNNETHVYSDALYAPLDSHVGRKSCVHLLSECELKHCRCRLLQRA